MKDTPMADLPSHPDSHDTGPGPDPRAGAGRPRWKSFALAAIAVVVVVAFVVLHLTGVLGPGEHT
jgi:hypothetical protein